MILCRNLVLTYFEPALQHALIARIVEALRPGSALIIGSQESLPDALPESAGPVGAAHIASPHGAHRADRGRADAHA